MANENEAEIEARISDLTAELQAKLKQIDPELIVQLRIGRGRKTPGNHFSDWHDNWRDGPRWSKTWGKAGGESDFDFEDFDDSFQTIKK